MHAYLLAAVGVIFLSVIASLLIPQGKLSKTITFVMRIICIVVLIQPVVKLFTPVSTGSSDGEFFDAAYVCSQYSLQQSRAMESLIEKEMGISVGCEVKVEYEDAQFKVEEVEVIVNESDCGFVEKIYEYLQSLGYINISVYAKSS